MRATLVLPAFICALLLPTLPVAQPAPADQQPHAQPRQLERYAPDRVLVKFIPGTAATQVAQAHRSASAMPIREIPAIGVQVVNVPAGSVMAQVAAYQANPNVLYAEPDYYRLLVVPSEEPGPTPAGGANYFSEQWYLNNTAQAHTYVTQTIFGPILGSTTGTTDADIDAPQAWDISQGVATTDPAAFDTAKVAVLDSGADCATLELSGKCLEQVNYVEGQSQIGDSCSPSDPACDNLGHGTFTASEIVANTDNGEGIAGAAWDTSAGIFKVCYLEWVTDGLNLFEVGLCPVSASAAAISEAASDRLGANGQVVRSQYHVISMSYGSDFIDADGGITPTDPSNAECDAVQFAVDNGVVVVAGAGNNGDTQRFYPAACTDGNGDSTVIAVAATDDDDYRSSFSTYSQNFDDWVSLAAPGEAIIGILPDAQCSYQPGTDSCVDWWSGTSMATPLVAGGAALVWADLYETLKAGGTAGEALAPANCTWKGLPCNQVVRQRLEDGADKIGAQGQNLQDWTRHGRLNIAGALALGGVEPPPPPPATPDAPQLVSTQVIDPQGDGNQWVRVTWSHNGENVTGFDIERNTLHKKNGSITSTTLIAVSGGTTLFYEDDVGSGRYSYRVRARNGQDASTWTDMSSVVTVSDAASGGGGKGGGKGGGGGKPSR
ncbi:S8 family serine peptidase [Pseudomonas sp. SA3-5]|uniref:S8 family serine peptidase n=1 Tax=Pseudomonas aestuarii TaxID=3018340 RepID=A0ABT4XC88_9PSED|nr:S8 family serine peptidase [Pseudomonas aestuarii]MDA7085798.1 S8 family serine peptidase [Pseudomonas aestuarii]